MKNFNYNLIESGKKVGVAVSGGSDSMALLHFLFINQKKLNISIYAINIDHSFRGEDSKKDSQFVADFCKANKIPLLFKKIECLNYASEKRIGEEEAGRILRYDYFFHLLREEVIDCIATAHHRRDNVESVFLHLFRGSGLAGVRGIRETNYDGKIIRPMLKVSKAEILEYLEQNHIDYVSDDSNFNDEYSRNYLRLNVFPMIEKRFSDFENAVERFSENVRGDDDLLEELAKDLMTIYEDKITVDIKNPKMPLIYRATNMALKKFGVYSDIEKVHYKAIFDLISKNSGKYLTLKSNIICFKDYDKLTFTRKKREMDLRTFDFKDIDAEEVSSFDKSDKESLFIDLDSLPTSVTIRKRQNGDVFTKYGGGQKKLKDYLIDKKIPQRDRDKILLIANGSEILVICGVEISDKVKITDKTKRILKIKQKREI